MTGLELFGWVLVFLPLGLLLLYLAAKLVAMGFYRGKADAEDYNKQHRTGGKMTNRFLSNQEEKN